ncbi:PREDICTED: recombination repair protein 1-like, partial [Papilio xuthus]|uniref:Recombination repair protein 1-like n=1 Tax=Papilio xuthus TaxID=66420 RepID=A0AAJ6ZKT7_PAPXU
MLTRCDSLGLDGGATTLNTDFDSDSSAASYMSVVSGESSRRAYLKRGRGSSDPEETSGAAPAKGAAHKSKRGRGRPLNVELADAEVAASLRTAREARASIPSGPAHLSLAELEEDQTSVALNQCVEASLRTILEVATKSTNIKGTLVKALKEAAANIKAAVSQLRERTMSEEVARLEAANARLQKDMEELRRELKDIDKRRPAQPGEADIRQLLEEVSRANVETFGTILNARLAGIEDRLLPEPRRRPPLAADRREEDVGPPSSPPKAKKGAKKKKGPAEEPLPTTSGSGAQDRASTSVAAPGEAPPKKKKGKKKKKQPSLATKEAAQARDRPAPTPAEAPWTTVVSRGAKKAAKKAAMGAENTRLHEKKTKLRAPKTAAVTLTLAPGAEESGATYAAVLAEAKSRINLAELGIADVKFRRAATGARMLEVGGEAAPEKADSLAARLREVLGPEV